MAKKTKELELIKSNIDISDTLNDAIVGATTKKNKTTSESKTQKKQTTKKSSTKKSKITEEIKSNKKVGTKKAPTKKSSVKKVSAKTVSTKKSTKKTSIQKKTSISKSKESLVEFKSEYYDLPYMYNRTIVKVLAQTPKTLFIYWEISEDDRTKLKQTYGDDFFQKTRPVLIVFNDTMHYSFEVDINDFANSWYLHINDANCNYHVELGRRPYTDYFQNNTSNENTNSTNINNSYYIPYYVYISSSNKMTTPNNKILFDQNIKTIKFRNIKTGQTIERNIQDFIFFTNFGLFSIKDLYQNLYPSENLEIQNKIIGNPSSGLTSSGAF